MKRLLVAVSLFVAFFAFGLIAAERSHATAVEVEQISAADGMFNPAPIEVAKKCSTSSDCPNSKCSSGKCGACSTSSDCKYGKCKSSQCGGCSTSSDCGGWGKCKSGMCGGCSTSSDCGGFGSCRSGSCEKTPY